MSRNIYRVGLFLLIWLAIGFATGTALLVGPVQWINSWGRSIGWSHTVERVVMISIILTYVVTTGLVSWWITKKLIESVDIFLRIVGIIALMAPAGIALWLWFHPSMMTGSSNPFLDTSPKQQFVFGDYPNTERIKQLEKKGFTAVVSLLHPKVVPFEPKLIEREKKRLKQSSLEFIHTPMLPWIGDNESSVKKLKELARSDKGKYYVHCYLGKDRVRVARRAIDKAGGNTDDELENSRRSITEIDRFERGNIFNLADSIYLTPYPTDEEFMGFVMNGQFDHVVSLLKSDKNDTNEWIQKESKLMERYNMGYKHWPVSVLPSYDPKRLMDVVSKVKDLNGQILVHDFLTEKKSPKSEAFLLAYKTGLRPIPPSLFESGLSNGEVQVTHVNLALGPQPTEAEIENILMKRGIRGLVYFGDDPPSSLQAITNQHDMGLKTLNSVQDFQPEAFSNSGPWYGFGPNVSRPIQSSKRLKSLLSGFDVIQ